MQWECSDCGAPLSGDSRPRVCAECGTAGAIFRSSPLAAETDREFDDLRATWLSIGMARASADVGEVLA